MQQGSVRRQALEGRIGGPIAYTLCAQRVRALWRSDAERQLSRLAQEHWLAGGQGLRLDFPPILGCLRIAVGLAVEHGGPVLVLCANPRRKAAWRSAICSLEAAGAPAKTAQRLQLSHIGDWGDGQAQAPNRQELGGDGQAPDRQEPEMQSFSVLVLDTEGLSRGQCNALLAFWERHQRRTPSLILRQPPQSVAPRALEPWLAGLDPKLLRLEPALGATALPYRSHERALFVEDSASRSAALEAETQQRELAQDSAFVTFVGTRLLRELSNELELSTRLTEASALRAYARVQVAIGAELPSSSPSSGASGESLVRAYLEHLPGGLFAEASDWLLVLQDYRATQPSPESLERCEELLRSTTQQQSLSHLDWSKCLQQLANLGMGRGSSLLLLDERHHHALMEAAGQTELLALGTVLGEDQGVVQLCGQEPAELPLFPWSQRLLLANTAQWLEASERWRFEFDQVFLLETGGPCSAFPLALLCAMISRTSVAVDKLSLWRILLVDPCSGAGLSALPQVRELEETVFRPWSHSLARSSSGFERFVRAWPTLHQAALRHDDAPARSYERAEQVLLEATIRHEALLDRAHARPHWPKPLRQECVKALEVQPLEPSLALSMRRFWYRLNVMRRLKWQLFVQALWAVLFLAVTLPNFAGPVIGWGAALLGVALVVKRTVWRLRRMRNRCLRPENTVDVVRDFGSIVLRTLRVHAGIHPYALPTSSIRWIELPDRRLLVWLENADAKTTARFVEALREALGPIKEHRYIIGRAQLELRRGTSAQSMSYHPVPSFFGAHRELAEAYAGHWAQVFGLCKLRYAGVGKGRLMRLAYGFRNRLSLSVRRAMVLR